MHFSRRPFRARATAAAAFSIVGQMIRIGCIVLIVAVAAGMQFPTLAINASPALPNVYLDTNYVLPTGVTRQVSAGGNLQATLNAAQPGDVILLQAGATFTGNFKLPNKTSGSGWIYIMGSASASLPTPGTRVGPSDAALMPKIVSGNTSPAITTEDATHHYRLVGLEISAPTGTTAIMTLGVGGGQTTLAQVPHDLVIDRCYIHGSPTAEVIRAIYLNSSSTSIIDSYIADIHSTGSDSQAIAAINGPGPYKIVNNHLEASGENVMFGGGDPLIPNLVPSDIEIRGNRFFKPLSWKVDDASYAGIHWSVKNLFELKNARRILITGNTFENNWADSQNGFGILFTPRNQGGTAPWSVVQDVTFTNNIIRNSAKGINILGIDRTFPASPSQRLARVLIRNNVWYGLRGLLFQVISGGDDITIEHNTGFPDPASGSTLVAGDGPDSSARFIFKNNLVGVGQYGVIGTNKAPGSPTLNAYFPGAVFTSNLLTGNLQGASYPSTTFNETSMDTIGFLDWKGSDYRLAFSSRYKNAGTDGKDLGVDFDALNAGGGGSSTGVLPAPTGLTVR